MSGTPWPTNWHRCNARCDHTTGVHCALIWARPIAESVTFYGPQEPPATVVIAKSLFSISYHANGWYVVRCEPATESPPPPDDDERNEPWLVFVAPCPDCGPPWRPPFDVPTERPR